MNFQVLLLVFAVVIATNIHCQAQSPLGDSNKSPALKGQVTSRQQGKTCNCSGRGNALEQNYCSCQQQRQYRPLTKEQAALCQKEGILTFKKCSIIRRRRKQKNSYSMPI